MPAPGVTEELCLHDLTEYLESKGVAKRACGPNASKLSTPFHARLRAKSSALNLRARSNAVWASTNNAKPCFPCMGTHDKCLQLTSAAAGIFKMAFLFCRMSTTGALQNKQTDQRIRGTMIEQKYTITRTRATWKPRVTDADMPFFTDKDGNTLVALSGDADAVYTGTGRTLVENPPTRILTMPSESNNNPIDFIEVEDLPEGIELDYQISGGFNNNAVYFKWKIADKTKIPNHLGCSENVYGHAVEIRDAEEIPCLCCSPSPMKTHLRIAIRFPAKNARSAARADSCSTRISKVLESCA